MAWLVLVISGALEAVWATALGQSHGLSRPTPTIVFAVAVTASMIGLGYAMKSIPIGVSYAIWVGIGATLTVAYSMATGAEPASLLKIALLTGIIACIVGLKLAP